MNSNKAIMREDAKLTKIMQSEIDATFYASCIVLNRIYGWKKLRISRLMRVVDEIYTECAGISKSLVQMCDEETGIEFRPEDGSSWKDAPYLNNDLWLSIRDKWLSADPNIQMGYQIRVKQKMRLWMKPQILSSLALALYRKEKWSSDKLFNLMYQVNDVIDEFNHNTENMSDYIFETIHTRYRHKDSNNLCLLQEVEE